MPARKTKRRSVARKPVAGKKIVKKQFKKLPSDKRKINQSLAIVALVLNVIILPGLGSLIGGRIKVGIWQLVLGIVGGLLFVFWIGIPIWLAGWIWGIVTGVQLIKEAQ